MTEIIDNINNILFWVFLYVLLWQVYYLLFNKAIPNITTAPAIRKAIIKKLKGLDLKNPTIYDLGCGNGLFTREIAQELAGVNMIGVEIDQIAYWRAALMKKIKGIKNLSYIKNDFYNINLSNADVVFFFLVGRDMSFIRNKLEKDLKSGAIVITNKFEMGGTWKPLEVCETKTLAPAQKTFYIYQYQPNKT